MNNRTGKTVMFTPTVMLNGKWSKGKSFEAEYISIPELSPYDFVLHKYGKVWVISECASGVRFCEMDTLDQLKDSIQERLLNYGVEDCLHRISECIRQYSKK